MRALPTQRMFTLDNLELRVGFWMRLGLLFWPFARPLPQECKCSRTATSVLVPRVLPEYDTPQAWQASKADDALLGDCLLIASCSTSHRSAQALLRDAAPAFGRSLLALPSPTSSCQKLIALSAAAPGQCAAKCLPARARREPYTSTLVQHMF